MRSRDKVLIMGFREKDRLLGWAVRPVIHLRLIRDFFADFGEMASLHTLLREHYPSYRFCGDRERLIRSLLGTSSDYFRIFEFGVGDGAMTRFLCGQRRARNFEYFGFDTFEGLPDEWVRGGIVYRPKGFFDLDGQFPDVEDSRVRFIKGFIENNLHLIDANLDNYRSVFLFDLDLYDPTIAVFKHLSDKFKSGDLIYFDEAFDSFNERRVIIDEILGNPKYSLVGASNIAAAFQVL